MSILALEAIGAVLLLSYGFSNAFWAIILASVLIFIAAFPISYYAARYNIDIDLLTRSAGFGYVGSTITSLIYASFCFIFFALEAAIMAQALELYFGLPLQWGYLLCSIIIIPIVFYGVTAINRLHNWTQPFWLVLMLLPLYFVLLEKPEIIELLPAYQGTENQSNDFDFYYFGIAVGISLSLIAQIGEQVDYLRFMPDKTKNNRLAWWSSVLAAGPGWIILGCFKQFIGVFLALLVVLTGLGFEHAKEPVHMYLAAYQYVFDQPQLALFVTTIFVIISQVKINVTNAYAGSLAWSNFFSRATYNHPGRVVWLVFNIVIALLLMEMGVFAGLNKVLGLYSNVAIAWIFTVFADLAINKPLKLSPSIVEFKRAHLYDFNPVGFVSMIVASIVSILAFTGLFGSYPKAYSWLIAIVISLILSPLIAFITKGKYYIARENTHFSQTDDLINCGICEHDYVENDMAHCPFHEVAICSLCCTLETNCRDSCKPKVDNGLQQIGTALIRALFKQTISSKTAQRLYYFILLSSSAVIILGFTFWLVFAEIRVAMNENMYLAIYVLFTIITVFIFIVSWWIILSVESRLLAENELLTQQEELEGKVIERTAELQQALEVTLVSEQYHKSLFDGLDIGLSINSMDGVFSYLNPALAKIVGYSVDEVKALSYWELTPEIYAADEQLQLQALKDTGHYGPYEKEYIHQDGSRIPIRLQGCLIEKEGFSYIWSSIEDITDINQQKLNLKQAKDEAEKANIAKSKFLSSMSHELRTPLNAILGFSQLLESDVDNPLTEEQRESIDYIMLSGKHLLTLINGVLELASIEAGKIELSIEAIVLDGIITEVLSLLSPAANKENITFKHFPNKGIMIDADQTKLKQVIINLVSNAIKYNQQHGRVIINCEEKNGMVRVNVIDTGIGITEKNKQKVFKAFNRLGQENSAIEGTGIGLVVTKELVEMMSGTMGFESIEHQGSTFWFELPLSKA